jgi:hypothetical protein
MNFINDSRKSPSNMSLVMAFILVLLSAALGSYLFFSNPWLSSDLHSNSYSWFLDFSRSIFQAQSAYYAESILLPLITKLIGATKSIENYKLLCGLLTISILPIASIFAYHYFFNPVKTLLFIILF